MKKNNLDKAFTGEELEVKRGELDEELKKLLMICNTKKLQLKSLNSKQSK